MGRPARMVRGIVLSAKERDFVRAARGFGASASYLLRRHILPEIAACSSRRPRSWCRSLCSRNDVVILGIGRPRASAQLGKHAGELAALQRAGFVLVDVFTCVSNGAVLLGYLVLASLLQQRSGTAKIEEARSGVDVSRRRSRLLSFGAAFAFVAILVCGLHLRPAASFTTYAAPANAAEKLLRVAGESGHAGGRIVIGLRSEPKTLNPLTAADGTPAK